MRDDGSIFEQHRAVLLGLAYRLLGSMHDAEDTIQDAWLRWAAEDRSSVREPRPPCGSRFILNTIGPLPVEPNARIFPRFEATIPSQAAPFLSKAVRNCPLCVMKNRPHPRVHGAG